MQSTTPTERRLLSASQVGAICGCSRPYVHQLVGRNVLPAPVYLHARAHPRWWSDEVEAALDKIRTQQAAEIAARRARARARQRGEKLPPLSAGVQS